jgi:streptogramin lyase
MHTDRNFPRTLRFPFTLPFTPPENNMAALARLAAATLACTLLSGCGLGGATSVAVNAPTGAAVHGSVEGVAMGGQDPIAGGSIYLYAANITTAGAEGYGAASTSLLKSGGNPVVPVTGSDGTFSITGMYTCPTPANTPVYLLITGGNPGLGTGTNPNIALMAALGSCDTLLANATKTFLNVNEVTTVASVYALSGFMSSKTSIGTSSTNLTGLNNAFATVNELVNLQYGSPYTTIPAGTATVPQNEIFALADVLAACVNSAGGSASENGGQPTTACGKLFADTSSGTAPTDTVQAVLNIAQNPAHNANAILGFVQSVGAPFPTTVSSVNDWTIALNYTGGGISTPQAVAIDAAGNAWIASTSNVVTKITPATGSFASGVSGYSGIQLDVPTSLAVDTAGNVWLANCASKCSGSANYSSVVKLVPSGNTVTASKFTHASLFASDAISIDGNNNAYVANAYGNSLTKFNSAGAVQSGTGITASGLAYPIALAIDSGNGVWSVSPSINTLVGLASGGAAKYDLSGLSEPSAVAIDHSNRVWVTNETGNSLSVFTSAGSPMSTPVGAGLNAPLALAFDGNGTAWVANANSSISVFSSAGVALSANAYTAAAGSASAPLAHPNSIAVDASGNVWMTNCGTYCTGTAGNPGSVTQFIGAATPVATPLAAAIAGNTLASRP